MQSPEGAIAPRVEGVQATYGRTTDTDPQPNRSKPRAKTRARRSALGVPSIPKLEQRHYDLIGLGLVALAVFFAFVFYFGWDGGKVGEALAEALLYLFGGVAYLAPLVLFGAGAIMILRPMLPAVRAFRTGALCLALGLMLGMAGGLLGLGADHPRRTSSFELAPEFLRVNGGVTGEARSLGHPDPGSGRGHARSSSSSSSSPACCSSREPRSPASSGRPARASRATTQRVRSSTGEFASVLTGRSGAPAVEEPLRAPTPSSSHSSPGSRPRSSPWYTPPMSRFRQAKRSTSRRMLPEPEPAPEVELVDPDVGCAAGPTPKPRRRPSTWRCPSSEPPSSPESGLTPMANRRSTVTEADGTVYKLPPVSLLKKSKPGAKIDRSADERRAGELIEALSHFGVDAKVIETTSGPHVTRFALSLAPGTKVSKVAALKDDLAYHLAATDVRILAPIPGQKAVGVEVPNKVRRDVRLGDVFRPSPEGWSPLAVWLGQNIAGSAVGTDLAKQPHLLIAGTTGAGKSSCVNSMLASILLRATPNEVRMVLVDPKTVELNYYEDIPHLLTPVVTSPRMAANVLSNLIKEMEARYGVMGAARARNIVELNKIRERQGEHKLPYILCVIDELADLMMVAPGEVEDSIIRLAQKSRAVGIHLLLATQRPERRHHHRHDQGQRARPHRLRRVLADGLPRDPRPERGRIAPRQGRHALQPDRLIQAVADPGQLHRGGRDRADHRVLAQAGRAGDPRGAARGGRDRGGEVGVRLRPRCRRPARARPSPPWCRWAPRRPPCSSGACESATPARGA